MRQKRIRGGLPETGEYEWRRVASREAARALFLEALQRCEPEVLKSLAEEPFQRFCDDDKRFCGDGGAEFAAALKAWLRRWHLPCPPENHEWCWTRAMYTLQAWRHTQPEWRGAQWAPPPKLLHNDPGDPSELAFRFVLKRPDVSKSERDPLDWWDPTIERKSDAWQRITDKIEKRLRCYFDSLERTFTQHAAKKPMDEPIDALVGYRKTPRKRALKHFEWLARYQVLGWSYEQIAHEKPLDRKTVEKGVKQAAELVGLALRPAHRGRPEGVAETRRRRVSEAGKARRKRRE